MVSTCLWSFLKVSVCKVCARHDRLNSEVWRFLWAGWKISLKNSKCRSFLEKPCLESSKDIGECVYISEYVRE